MRGRIVAIGGPPGTGKDTLTNAIRQIFSFTTLGTGGVLRDIVRSKASNYIEIAESQQRGDLTPNYIFLPIFLAELRKWNGTGHDLILNGGLREISHAVTLAFFLKEKSPSSFPIHYLDFRVGQNESEEEEGLRVCFNRIMNDSNRTDRTDGADETIRNRFRVFRKNNQPLVQFIRSNPALFRYHEVNALNTPESVALFVESVVEKIGVPFLVPAPCH